MWKIIVEPSRAQMKIWHMCILCWIPKASNTHSGYVILIAFPQQRGCTNTPHCYVYTYIGCPVDLWIGPSFIFEPNS